MPVSVAAIRTVVDARRHTVSRDRPETAQVVAPRRRARVRRRLALRRAAPGGCPFWLPFVVLLAAELEFVLRGRLRGRPALPPHVPPGPEDADLGFGELVEDDDGYRYVPPPHRARRRDAAARPPGLVGASPWSALFVVAARADRAATWTVALRRRARPRRLAARVRGGDRRRSARDDSLRRGVRLHRRRQRHARDRLSPRRRSPTSTRASVARSAT